MGGESENFNGNRVTNVTLTVEVDGGGSVTPELRQHEFVFSFENTEDIPGKVSGEIHLLAPYEEEVILEGVESTTNLQMGIEGFITL